MTDQQILQLEHDTLRPLGEYPDHCSRCRRIHDCTHEHVAIEKIRTVGGGLIRELRYCECCGIDPEEMP